MHLMNPYSRSLCRITMRLEKMFQVTNRCIEKIIDCLPINIRIQQIAIQAEVRRRKTSFPQQPESIRWIGILHNILCLYTNLQHHELLPIFSRLNSN